MPASVDALVNTWDDSTAARTESYTIGTPYSYKLGSSGTGSIPSAWQAVPRGAPPVGAPTAPTAAAIGSAVGGGDLPNHAYTWKIAYLTAYGPSNASAASGSVTTANGGALITLPALPNTPYNPILGTIIYRNTNAHTTTWYLVEVITDLTQLKYIDTHSDEMIDGGTTSSSTDNSGITPTVSSTSDPVQVTGPLAAGGSGLWQEIGWVPGVTTVATEQFAVDYLNDVNGGTVYFSSSDNGKVVSVKHTSSISLTAAFENSIIQGLKDTAKPPIARVSSSVPQSIPTLGTGTDVVFDTEDFDTAAMANLGTHNDRITVTSDGVYRATFDTIIDSTNATYAYAVLQAVRGGSTFILAQQILSNAPINELCLHVEATTSLSTGDFIFAGVFHDSNIARSISPSSVGGTRMVLEKIY